MSLHPIHPHIQTHTLWLVPHNHISNRNLSATPKWGRPWMRCESVTVAASFRRRFRHKPLTHAKAEADADADVNADSGDDNDKRDGDDRERDFSHKWRSSNVAKSSCYCSAFLLLLHANRSATSRLCIINSFCMSGSTIPIPSRPYPPLPLSCSYRNCQRHLVA